METVLQIIRDYGFYTYVILFLYCALKSGSLPLFAGVAAHLEALDIGLVAIVVFLGGYLGDELRFYLGKKYGVENLSKRPGYQKALQTAKLLLEHYGKAYIFLYRYPKGMRTIGALPVTLTEMPWRTFTFLNAMSALTWTFALVGLGYLLGSVLDEVIGDNWGAFSVGLLSVFILMSYVAWRKVKVV